MTLPTKKPLPQPFISYLTAQGQLAFAQYLPTLDALVAALASGNIGALVNAANDAAAAKAGVAIGAMYRNGSQIMVRVS